MGGLEARRIDVVPLEAHGPRDVGRRGTSVTCSRTDGRILACAAGVPRQSDDSIATRLER
jgi:hypothetical protein